MAKKATDDGSGKATLATIAEAAGVSKALVSRVLSGRTGTTRFSTATAERVKRVARSLSYVTRTSTHSVGISKTMTLGLAIPITAYAYMAIVAAAIHAAGKLGYELLVTGASGIDGDEYARRIEGLMERNIDGLVIVPSGPFQQSLAYRRLLTAELPTVLVEHDIRNSGFDFIGMDDTAAYREVVGRLKAAGHSKIGLIYELEAETLSGHQRLVDFERVLDEYGLPITPRNYFQAIDKDSIDTLRRIYGKGRLVTAAVIRGRSRMLWAMEEFAKLGLRIPDDLSVVNICGYDYSENKLQIDSVRTPLQALGTRAVEMLVERISDRDLPARHELRAGTFHSGHTLLRVPSEPPK